MKRQLTYLEKRYGIIFDSKPLYYEVNVYSDLDSDLNRCFRRGDSALKYACRLVSQDVYCEINAVLLDGSLKQVVAC